MRVATQFKLIAVASGSFVAVLGWTAEPDNLAAKAANWVDRPLEEYGIDVLDGIDQHEARIIGDWVILPVVAKTLAEKIVSYSEPVSDGPYWRIDVVTNATPGTSPHWGPLFMSKLSGRQFGKGWGTYGGGPIADLGPATCFINDNGSKATATVTLKGFRQPGDFAAKATLLECVYRLVEKLNSSGNGLLEKISPTDIRVIESQAHIEFSKPGDPDRSWIAEIILRPKTSAL